VTHGSFRIAPAERGRPHEVLAFIDAIEADHIRSWALAFPALSNAGRLRLLRADQSEVASMALGLLRGAVHISQAEGGIRR
jgi:hypothetical protein